MASIPQPACGIHRKSRFESVTFSIAVKNPDGNPKRERGPQRRFQENRDLQEHEVSRSRLGFPNTHRLSLGNRGCRCNVVELQPRGETTTITDKSSLEGRRVTGTNRTHPGD